MLPKCLPFIVKFKDDFTYQNAETHRQHVDAIIVLTAAKTVGSFWKRSYGGNLEPILFEN